MLGGETIDLCGRQISVSDKRWPESDGLSLMGCVLRRARRVARPRAVTKCTAIGWRTSRPSLAAAADSLRGALHFCRQTSAAKLRSQTSAAKLGHFPPVAPVSSSNCKLPTANCQLQTRLPLPEAAPKVHLIDSIPIRRQVSLSRPNCSLATFVRRKLASTLELVKC